MGKKWFTLEAVLKEIYDVNQRDAPVITYGPWCESAQN